MKRIDKIDNQINYLKVLNITLSEHAQFSATAFKQLIENNERIRELNEERQKIYTEISKARHSKRGE